MGKRPNDVATTEDAGLESLAVTPELLDERRRHYYLEVPDDFPADWLKYNARRRLDAVRAVLRLPPITIRWFIDAGDTLRELVSTGRAVAHWWECSYEEAVKQHLYAGDDDDTGEDGHRLGFASRNKPNTIWVRAEAWAFAPSARKRSTEQPLTVGEAVTHECRHLWQYAHFDAATLADKQALEHDAYTYAEYFGAFRGFFATLPPFRFFPTTPVPSLAADADADRQPSLAVDDAAA